jgi:hypothetical protein
MVVDVAQHAARISARMRGIIGQIAQNFGRAVENTAALSLGYVNREMGFSLKAVKSAPPPPPSTVIASRSAFSEPAVPHQLQKRTAISRRLCTPGLQ